MYKRSFVLFLSYFNRNYDYFECHEVLEEHWKDVAPGVRDHELVGFIQLATGMYHWRRQNFVGAHRILMKAQKHLHAHPSSTYYTGLSMKQLFIDLQRAIEQTAKKQSFTNFPLAITDSTLQQLVDEEVLPSLSADFIQNKHRLRDRQDVIQERLDNLSIRQKARQST